MSLLVHFSLLFLSGSDSLLDSKCFAFQFPAHPWVPTFLTPGSSPGSVGVQFSPFRSEGLELRDVSFLEWRRLPSWAVHGFSGEKTGGVF